MRHVDDARMAQKSLSHKVTPSVQLFQLVYLFVMAQLIHTPPSITYTSTNARLSATHHLDPLTPKTTASNALT
jgi:hypothetical protein